MRELQHFASTVEMRIASGGPLADPRDAPCFAAKVDGNLQAFQPYLEMTGI